jgi:hypothetical protein
MLHIPKTGGLAVKTLTNVLNSKGLIAHPSANPQPLDDYSKFAYVHGHFGIKPMIEYPEIQAACLVRDPLDRVVSNFIWLIMNNELQEQEPYVNLSTIYQKMHYYLIEDSDYSKNNLITRFLSNGIDDDFFRLNNVSIFRKDGSLIDVDRTEQFKEYYKHWFVDNNTSLEVAKQYLDKIAILGVTEHHDAFMDKIFKWFIDNYNLDIKQEYLDENAKITNPKNIPYVNYSNYTDSDGTTYTTESLKALLTEEDIAKIYENNALDLELYNYAKEKLQ